jgi:hypothetical protein
VVKHYQGEIAEIMVFNRALGEEERQGLEAYVHSKYGVGAAPSLPSPVLPPATVFSTAISVAILPLGQGATLYYTTNGTSPTTNSAVYVGPVSISNTTTLKVMAVRGGYSNSLVETATYTKDSSADFNRAGLQLWLRGDQGTSLSGSNVTAWRDLSGSNNHAAQSAATNQPVLLTNSATANSNAVVRFDGVNDFLSVADSAGLKPAKVTIYAVARHTSGGNSGILLAKSQSTAFTNGYGVLREDAADILGFFANANGGVSGTSAVTGTIAASNTFLLQASYDLSHKSLMVNGVPLGQEVSQASITNSTQPLLIGGNGGAPHSLGSDVAELMVFDRPLPLAEQAKVEKYLGLRYGLTSDGDGDGLPRWKEIEIGTDPADPDSNGNGLEDGAEVSSGYNPTSNDTDGDGLTNSQESSLGTNPFWADTDGDGVQDGTDIYPLDPTASAWSDPTPSTAPTINLILPTTAVQL